MAGKKPMSVEESLTAFDKTIGEARGALDLAAAVVSRMRGPTVDTSVAYNAIEDAARNLRNALDAASTQLNNLRLGIRPGLE